MSSGTQASSPSNSARRMMFLRVSVDARTGALQVPHGAFKRLLAGNPRGANCHWVGETTAWKCSSPDSTA